MSSIDTTGMSEGKKRALELTESSREGFLDYPSFAGSIFMGELPLAMVTPYPERPEDRDERGRAFLDQLEAFLREHVDADQIDEDGEIPEHVVDGLRQLGAFGIKIPKQYGGLGLSQQVYTRAAVLVGSFCGSISALLSAHQSIGVPQPLLLFGTDAQKEKFLPRVAAGEISAFALTETGVGSDPARMETRAEPTEDGTHYVLNGEKLWCTNGTRAALLVVMAKTPSVKAGGRDRVTAFVVDADSPGVEVTHRSRFLGLRALYNGVIRFTNVEVPADNIIAAEGKGLRVALTTLNTGRITLPAMCVGLSKRSLRLAMDWANEREQWGATIGKHGAIADKIAHIASSIFAMESMTYLTSALVDRKSADVRIEAAMSKMFASEAAWKNVDEAMQIIGGRGYETAASQKARGETPRPIERALRDARINRIFEGSTEIMQLFIAREAMDPHLRVAGKVMDSRLPMRERLAAGLKALGFYATWYPKQWLPSAAVPNDMDPALSKHVRYAAKTSKKLARRLFHQMVKHGPKLEREQMLLSRFVNVGTELFAQTASATRAQALIGAGHDRHEVVTLVEHFCIDSRRRIDRAFEDVRDNSDREGYRLAQRMLAGEASWLFDGIVRLDLRRASEPEEPEQALSETRQELA